jgi:hypothetical protein
MYTPTAEHTVAITIAPGPDIAPQISYHIRDMINRALREAPEPIRSAQADVVITRMPAGSQCCVVRAEIDINSTPMHFETNGVTAREAIDLFEEQLRRRLGDPSLIISPN